MLKIPPPIWFFFFLLTALALHRYVPSTHVFELPLARLFDVLGVVLFLVGMYLSLAGSKLFKEENTEILPTSPTNRALVTRGVFRASRNPMYLGMVLSLLGIACFVGTLPVFLAACAHFCVLNFLFIPFEESKMQRQFGEKFIAYKASVRRWL